MGLRRATAAENEAAGVEPLGRLVGLPPAKASIPDAPAGYVKVVSAAKRLFNASPLERGLSFT